MSLFFCCLPGRRRRRPRSDDAPFGCFQIADGFPWTPVTRDFGYRRRRSRHSGPWVFLLRRCRRCHQRYRCRGEQLCPQRSMVRILLSFVVFLSPRRRLTRFLSPCSRRSAVVPLVNIGTHSATIPDLRRRGFNVGSCRVDSDLVSSAVPQHWRSVATTSPSFEELRQAATSA